MQVTISFGEVPSVPPSPALRKLQQELDAKKTLLYGTSSESEMEKVLHKLNER